MKNLTETTTRNQRQARDKAAAAPAPAAVPPPAAAAPVPAAAQTPPVRPRGKDRGCTRDDAPPEQH